MTDGELEAQVKHIVMHHVVQAHGKNLGQYRTEYVCGCGIPHIVDDHNPNERGIMDRQAEHIAIEVVDLIKQNSPQGEVSAESSVPSFHASSIPDDDFLQSQPKDDAGELREQLAAIEHTRWADWMEYMLSIAVKSGDDNLGIRVCAWPTAQFENWQRQIETDYEELSDKEKASDLEQVDRYWPLIHQQRLRWEARARKQDIEIVEAEYQKCRTIGRVNEEGYTKLYVQSEYRDNVKKAIASLAAGDGKEEI